MGKIARRITLAGLVATQCLVGLNVSFAGDVKIPIPKRGVSTPTEKLNREGVAELRRGHRDKAKQLFYKAYLFDPQDPFTLNNLGYVAELEGDAERALRYYELAEKDHTDAIIDRSSEASLKGKPLDAAFHQIEDADRSSSKISEQAIVLIQKGHVFEAKNLLVAALPAHPHDPFLLNNAGYTMESIGDLEGALRYYSAAASLHSTQLVIVTPRAKWRGKPISEIAAANARAINEQISRGEGVEAVTARLNLRGVAALNDNDPAGARAFFLQAYQRDAQNAFTLNNLGYISELQGDWESAESYYEASRSGRDANARVSYSTRKEAEGEKIDSLANNNQSSVETTLKTMQAVRRRGNQPVELIPRENAPAATQPATPVPPVGMQPPPMPALPPPTTSDQR